MKCYNHHDRDAFGICKSCGKGLCLECLKEENGTILCKDNPKCSVISKKCCILSFLSSLLLLTILIMMIID